MSLAQRLKRRVDRDIEEAHDVAPLIERRDDLVRRRERRDELVGVPVRRPAAAAAAPGCTAPDRSRCRNTARRRTRRPGRSRRRPRGCRRAGSANPCRSGAASSAPRGAFSLRASEPVAHAPTARHWRWRYQMRQRGERLDQFLESNSARRARPRCAASRRASGASSLPASRPRAASLAAEPGAHLGLGAAVERQRIVAVENDSVRSAMRSPSREPSGSAWVVRPRERGRPSRGWCGRHAACAGT